MGYRCLDHKTDRVYLSRNVCFSENHFSFGDSINKSPALSTLAFIPMLLHLLLPPISSSLPPNVVPPPSLSPATVPPPSPPLASPPPLPTTMSPYPPSSACARPLGPSLLSSLPPQPLMVTHNHDGMR